MATASCGFLEVVCKLLKHPDLDVNMMTPAGDTALLYAVRKHQKNILQLLCILPQLDISKYNTSELVPLTEVVRAKDIGIVQLLLQDSRFHINLTNSKRPCNAPLHEAVKLEDSSILKLLL